MIHFSCDLCGKDLATTSEARFVVKIAAYAGFDPDQLTDDDLDADGLEEVAKALRHETELGEAEADLAAPKGFRFDLCPACHEKFVKDPLGKELARTFDFSGFSKN